MGNSSVENFQEVTVVPVAISGPCAQICHTIYPFMLLLFIMSLAVSITQMPLLMIVLRSVSQEERSFALGMQFVIFRLFGYIPSPILFGNVIDSTCLLWKAQCERSGFCLIYDIEQFRFRYVGVCAAIKVLAAALFWVDWYLIRQRYEDGQAMMSVGTSPVPLDKRASGQGEEGYAVGFSTPAAIHCEPFGDGLPPKSTASEDPLDSADETQESRLSFESSI